MTHNTKKLSSDIISSFYDRVDDMLASDFIKKRFGGISIQLFGGEPTTNPEFVNEVLHRYKDNDRVEFLIFTNGYNIDPIVDTLEEIKDKKYRTVQDTTKCITQVSFDGTKMQDINRRTASGKPSSDSVKATIDTILEKKIPFAIKSTVTEETLHLMPESYDEVLDIAKRADRVRYSSYFPTLDYTDRERNLEKYMPIMKETLLIMAKRDIEHYKEYGNVFFKWFSDSKSLCSAGFAMSVMNTDGNIYPCHGCLYGDQLDKHLITNIKNDVDYVNIIEETSAKFEKIYKRLPEKCRNCDTSYCLKCNSTKFEVSDEKAYFDRWTDHTCQPDLCDYYMLISEVRQAMKPFMRR
jgi:radical SAM protein with 4Fe4S-binding SPASM domain